MQRPKLKICIDRADSAVLWPFWAMALADHEGNELGPSSVASIPQ